jgi:hypothetical protein
MHLKNLYISCKCNWHFTTENARIKLSRLYPIIASLHSTNAWSFWFSNHVGRIFTDVGVALAAIANATRVLK